MSYRDKENQALCPQQMRQGIFRFRTSGRITARATGGGDELKRSRRSSRQQV
jgi:hypothetical protein